MTAVDRARAFQNALSKARNPVDAVYYPEGGHNGLFSSPSQHKDEVERITSFLHQHVGQN